MIKKIENENKPLMENCFIEDNDFYVHAWYGLNYFEMGTDLDEQLPPINRREFLKLYELMTEMKKEIDRLENL